MCSRSINALLRYFIKRSTLITSSFLEAPLQRAGRTEDVVQVSHCEHVRLYAEPICQKAALEASKLKRTL